MTYRFRIDPNARFSDGVPVTSEDVVATYDFLMDKTLQAPMEQITYSQARQAGCRKQVHRSSPGQGIELEKFPVFLGNGDFPGTCLEDRQWR